MMLIMGQGVLLFSCGEKVARRECSLIDATSHLLLLLDSREYLTKIPEDIRRLDDIRIDRYDAIIFGLEALVSQHMAEIERIYKKRYGSEKSLHLLKEKIETAREIAKTTKILKIQSAGSEFPYGQKSVDVSPPETLAK